MKYNYYTDIVAFFLTKDKANQRMDNSTPNSFFTLLYALYLDKGRKILVLRLPFSAFCLNSRYCVASVETQRRTLHHQSTMKIINFPV